MFVFWGNHFNQTHMTESFSGFIILKFHYHYRFHEFCLWQKWGKIDTKNENAPHDSNKSTSPPQLTPPPWDTPGVTSWRLREPKEELINWSHLQSGLRRAPPPSAQQVCWPTVESWFRLTGKKDRLEETKMEDPAIRFHRLSSRVWETQYCSLE